MPAVADGAAPTVAVKEGDEAEAGAPAGAAGELTSKAEAEEPEQADYGGDEPEAAPKRAMPDYADLIDDDDDVRGKKPEIKEAKVDTKSEARPEGIYIMGVQRLTRAHLEEVFDSKGLKSFVTLEWLEDDQVICVFANERDGRTALASVQGGFGDVAMDEDERPGPGLWRAQRGMLEFREATTSDVPDPSFKRVHRAGRQVREYRFWEAVKDVDRNIMEGNSLTGQKRVKPSGEDAFAAALMDDEDDDRPTKRRRVGGRGGTDEESIDILEQMSRLDKAILVKQEDDDISELLQKARDAPPPPGVLVDGKNTPWDHGDAWYSEGWGQDWWGNDEADWWGDSGSSSGRNGGRGKGGRRKDGGKGRKGSGKGGDRGGGGGGRSASALEGGVSNDEEERARRAKRSQRFQTPEVSTKVES